MQTEKIRVRATDNDQTIEVAVYDKKASCIQVMVGEGIHSVKCSLTPTTNGRAYAGNVMGRELVYERSPDQVRADIEKATQKPIKSWR